MVQSEDARGTAACRWQGRQQGSHQYHHCPVLPDCRVSSREFCRLCKGLLLPSARRLCLLSCQRADTAYKPTSLSLSSKRAPS